MALIDWDRKELSIKDQAQLLSLNRSSLYYRKKGVSEFELAVKRAIDEIYTDNPCYGSRRIKVLLRRHGFKVNRKRVQRYMREMGLIAIHPGPNLSKRNRQYHVYPYLLRNITPSKPNQVWGIDITYIRMKESWMYLVAIIDWYSRYIIDWELSQTLAKDFVLATVQRALSQAVPDILNSDQGSHFTSPAYIQLLQEQGIRISMDGRGRALDNIITERFWRTLKYEEVYLNEYETPRQARQCIARFIHIYNHARPHQSLNYRTPAEVHMAQEVKSSSNSLVQATRSVA